MHLNNISNELLNKKLASLGVFNSKRLASFLFCYVKMIMSLRKYGKYLNDFSTVDFLERKGFKKFRKIVFIQTAARHDFDVTA
ncbi:Uncharacterised protein [Mycobacteroides abscessus subsp. abscessus]|nr:Uncharacterised protein [Mycobacteroides abscessus subsp. abscessus]